MRERVVMLLGRLGVPLTLAVAGLLFATTASTASGTDLRAARHTELSDLIVSQQRDVAHSLARVQELRGEVASLSRTLGGQQVRSAERLAHQRGVAAGTTAVRGPGISVSLDDAVLPAQGIPTQFVPDDYLVHQQDVQAVVNALWSGGAEAVEIMDQRLVSTSAVRCVGNVLVLHGRVYSPPYVITAIGPPTSMDAALRADRTVSLYRQWVSLVGLGYQVSLRSEVTLPAYDGSLDLTLQTVAPANGSVT
jgi:uncharacterized protein YlxW (UPF0749 family)